MERKGITQVGILVEDIQKAVEHYWSVLGIGPWSIYSFTQDTVRDFKVYGRSLTVPFKFVIAKSMFGNVDVELIQHIEGPTIFEKFIKEKGFGLHHIKEQMDDIQLERTLKEYKEKGIDVIQRGQFGENIHNFLNTEPLLGIVYEVGNFGKVPKPDRRYPPD